MPRPGVLAQSLAGAPAMRWLLRVPLWRGALVLGYHRILEPGCENPFDDGVVSASPAAFDAQLALLERHFEVATPDALTTAPRSRARRVVVTFDDGYRDSYEQALPVLRRRGVRAAFFLTTGFLDRPAVPWWDELAWMVKRARRPAVPPGAGLSQTVPLAPHRGRAVEALTAAYKALPSDRTGAFLEHCGHGTGAGRCPGAAAAGLWMTWEMAERLRDAGMAIGGHTVSHPVLGRCDEARQRAEIDGCSRQLRERLGVRMRHFAYPVGLASSHDAVTRRLLREAGVELAFSLHGGLAGRSPDPYDVPRASVTATAAPGAFGAALAAPRLFARW